MYLTTNKTCTKCHVTVLFEATTQLSARNQSHPVSYFHSGTKTANSLINYAISMDK